MYLLSITIKHIFSWSESITCWLADIHQGRIAQCSKFAEKSPISNWSLGHGLLLDCWWFFFFRKCEFFCREFLKYFFKDFRALCIMKLVIVVTHTVSTHIGKHALYNFWQLKIEINASTSPLNFKNISKSSFFVLIVLKKLFGFLQFPVSRQCYNYSFENGRPLKIKPTQHKIPSNSNEIFRIVETQKFMTPHDMLL